GDTGDAEDQTWLTNPSLRVLSVLCGGAFQRSSLDLPRDLEVVEARHLLLLAAEERLAAGRAEPEVRLEDLDRVLQAAGNVAAHRVGRLVGGSMTQDLGQILVPALRIVRRRLARD